MVPTTSVRCCSWRDGDKLLSTSQMTRQRPASMCAALLLAAAAVPASANPSSRHLPPPRPFTHQDRDQHTLNAAGLKSDGSTSDPSPFSQKFPTDLPGIFFSGIFTNHTVLQRGPETSAVYGVVIGGAAAVQVALSGTAESGEVESVSGITATVDASTLAKFGYARWKAVLPARPAGGSFSVTASCTGCQNQTETTISDVTFGDVRRRHAIRLYPPP